MPRVAAALIALAAWFGLIVQWQATYADTHSAGAALWILVRFFTILTNFAVAVTMTLVALGRRVGPFLIGGITLAILLVGIVYSLLLRGTIELTGDRAVLADHVMHEVVPVLVALYWLFLAKKGGLGWRDPLLWALYPLAYFLYAMIRGQAEGKYPYPFIDVGALGLGGVAFNAAAIAASFVVGGEGMVALDRLLAGRRATR